MAALPVLVVHGVANRNQGEFVSEVAAIQKNVGAAYSLIPVWWADLGGQTDFLADTLPQMDVHQVRSEQEERDIAALAASIAERHLDYVVRMEGDREAVIIQAAHKKMGRSEEVRAGDEVDDAIHEGWASAKYLPLIQDQRALEAIGRAVGVTSGSVFPGEEEDSPYVTRGSQTADEYDTRGLRENVGKVARAVMGEIDKIVGYAVGQVAGDLNQTLRMAWAAPIGLFFGDILAYQRKQQEIQARLAQAIEQHAPGWGTKEKPIAVTAHSLGGVIAFDAATRATDPLYVSNLITFGSQASFFAVLDPRASLAQYSPGSPIVLPGSIAHWTSLWEPMDFLAFAAAKVFRLVSGVAPTDIRTVHELSNGLYTHGSYWHGQELIEAIRQIPLN